MEVFATEVFRYPVRPVPRTAVLVPWFKERWFPALRARVERRAPVATFRQGWGREAARFQPAAIAGTFGQICAIDPAAVPSLTHAIVILWRPGQPRLSAADHDRLWMAFRVPVFEQIIGASGETLASECEAHEGLHLQSPGLSLPGETLEMSPCPCGRKMPRIGVTRPAAKASTEPLRTVAAAG
jgi:hypothetical protein